MKSQLQCSYSLLDANLVLTGRIVHKKIFLDEEGKERCCGCDLFWHLFHRTLFAKAGTWRDILFSAVSRFSPPDIYMEAALDTLKFDFNLLFQLCFIFFPRSFGYHTQITILGRVYFFSLFSSIDMDTVMEGITKENKEKSRDFFFPLL